jgi:GH15 family glucan-1,4-alpha-glucosidase
MAGLIEDYALLGDLQTAALVCRDGSLDWLCLPRFDSPACFAALLDSPEAGRWKGGPRVGGPSTRRRYRGDTLVLEQEWDTPDGTVRVVDLMPVRGQAADVVRIVEGVTGTVRVRSELRLRFDYGSVRAMGEALRHGDGCSRRPGRRPPRGVGSRCTARRRDVGRVRRRAGEQVAFVLTWSPSHEPEPRPVDPLRALADTERFWADWWRSAPTTATGRRPSGGRW